MRGGVSHFRRATTIASSQNIVIVTPRPTYSFVCLPHFSGFGSTSWKREGSNALTYRIYRPCQRRSLIAAKTNDQHATMAMAARMHVAAVLRRIPTIAGAALHRKPTATAIPPWTVTSVVVQLWTRSSCFRMDSISWPSFVSGEAVLAGGDTGESVGALPPPPPSGEAGLAGGNARVSPPPAGDRPDSDSDGVVAKP